MSKKKSKQTPQTVSKVTEAPVEISVAEVAEVAAETVAETAANITEQSTLSEGQVQVDVEYLRSTRIHCAVPCNHGLISEAAFVSFLKFAGMARQLGLEWTVETISNDTLLPRARNTLVAKFLSQPTSTHLAFIDGDMSWEPWQLLVLINRQLDVVGGLYSGKSLPIRWMVNTFPGAEETDDGLHEVNRIGCGFLVVKREVFEKLATHPEVKPYKNDIGLDSAVEPYLRTYFDTRVKDGAYLSEDWTFCENWLETGGKLYVDKRVMVSNIGQFQYGAQTQDQILNTFGPQYLDLMRNRGLIETREPMTGI